MDISPERRACAERSHDLRLQLRCLSRLYRSARHFISIYAVEYYRWTMHRCVIVPFCVPRPQNLLPSSLMEVSTAHANLSNPHGSRNINRSIVSGHDLCKYQLWVAGYRDDWVSANEPSVRLPLSDCTFKYNSTIWHQPPGRVTRSISRMYCVHRVLCMPDAIIWEWTRSKWWEEKVNLCRLSARYRNYVFNIPTACSGRPVEDISYLELHLVAMGWCQLQ
jgi:hypothetical protein